MPDVLSSQLLRCWVILCLGKLCKDFTLAKYMFLTELGYTQFIPLLSDTCPVVRAAAVSALGEVFGASDGNINQASSHISASGHSLLSARANLSSSSLNTPFSTDSPKQFSAAPIGVRPNGLTFSASSNATQFGTPAAGTNSVNAAAEQHVLRQMEIQLAMCIVERLNDGSVSVRREAIIALSKVKYLCHWRVLSSL
jgi:HEAT repeat protein